MKKHKFIYLADIILIAVILSGAFLWNVLKNTQEPSCAVIYVDGQEYKRVDLKIFQEINIEKVKIIVEDETVCIVSSDCPDKTCVKSGKIKSVGSTVACVPNKIVVTIVKNHNYVDGVTG